MKCKRERVRRDAAEHARVKAEDKKAADHTLSDDEDEVRITF